jgi:hypothetical protein
VLPTGLGAFHSFISAFSLFGFTFRVLCDVLSSSACFYRLPARWP